MKRYIEILILVNLLVLITNIECFSQKDTLALDYVIKTVVENHPLIAQAKELIKSSNYKIDLSKSLNYPQVDFNGNYTRLGPISSINFGSESFEMFPANNYNLELEIKQIIYDFGKLSSGTDLEVENSELAVKSIEQIKQKLANSAIGIYYNLIYLQEAIRIKDMELSNLNEQLDFVEKKHQTGSAINYEILTTKVKISKINSQKTDLIAIEKTQKAYLNTLMGINDNRIYNVRTNFDINKDSLDINQLLNTAYQQRSEVSISEQKTKIAELNYKLQEKTNYPSLFLFANGGVRNGLFPDMYRWLANYAVGVGLNVPIFDGFKNNNKLSIANSSIINSKLETDVIKQNITNEVNENLNNLNSAKEKIEQFTIQEAQSEKAYELAKINFTAGAITNLDLLDAQTNVSESRLLLLKANIDYKIDFYKLKYAVGDKLY